MFEIWFPNTFVFDVENAFHIKQLYSKGRNWKCKNHETSDIDRKSYEVKYWLGA